MGERHSSLKAQFFMKAAVCFLLGATCSFVMTTVWHTYLLRERAVAQKDDVPRSALAMFAVRAASHRPRVVVSLTTFPVGDRMGGIDLMLRSMDNQTWRPDKVIINFPYFVKRLSS